MRKFLRTMLLVPLGCGHCRLFTVANRHLVTVSFDPFDSGDSAFGLPPLPLFVVIIAAADPGSAGGWFRDLVRPAPLAPRRPAA